MAYKFTAVVALAAIAALTATGCGFAEEASSASDWKPPQTVGMPGYKEEVSKPREVAPPRAIGQDPHAARNPNLSSQDR